MTTLMACSPAVMDQETSYLTLLSRAATYSVSGDTMLFYDSMGTLVLAYKNPVSTPVVTASSQPPIVGSWDLVTYNNGNNGLGAVLQAAPSRWSLPPVARLPAFRAATSIRKLYPERSEYRYLPGDR